MPTITCRCGATATVTDDRKLQTVKDETGWFPFMSTESGLTHVWICSPCNDVVVEAGKKIQRVFGDSSRYIYLSNLFREPHR